MRRHDDLRCGVDAPADRVPIAFLLVQVVGWVSVRFELDAFPATQGGHIGCGVRPQFERQGHARQILRPALVVARADGVDRVLVTCDRDDVGSAAVFLGAGGVEGEPWTGADGSVTRRSWID